MVSVFHGADDDITPISFGEDLFGLVPEDKKGQLRSIEGAGHSLIFDSFNVDDFLALRELIV